MSQKFYTDVAHLGAGFPIIAKNSEAFHKGDPVMVASGFLLVATATSKILGWCDADFTATADNQTVAKLCPTYVPATEEVKMLITPDQTFAQTDVGLYADISGTTGAIAVNLAGGGNGQLYVHGVDPMGSGDVVVSVAEPSTLAFAQA
jgi:hypothetical protein